VVQFFFREDEFDDIVEAVRSTLYLFTTDQLDELVSTIVKHYEMKNKREIMQFES